MGMLNDRTHFLSTFFLNYIIVDQVDYENAI